MTLNYEYKPQIVLHYLCTGILKTHCGNSGLVGFTGDTHCHSFLRPRSVLMALGPTLTATHMPFIVFLLLLIVAIYLL